MIEPSFAELVKRARHRDAEAVRWLIEQYESAIRRQARFMLRDSRLRRVLDDTDICQSVLGRFFVGFWAGKFEFDSPEQLIGYLREMVRNKIYGQARYWRAGRRDLRRNVSLCDPNHFEEPVSPGPTPSRAVANAELLAEFERRLSNQEREILVLRRKGLSWAEVANRVDGGGAEAIRKRFERSRDYIGRELCLSD